MRIEKVLCTEIGISPKSIDRFLDIIEENRIRLHSFIIMRNGKIGAEGYWKPFSVDTPHRMYSVTKTFVATAIGVLADEGKISLDDKVASFFPELVPKNVHKYIDDATIRDLLTMSTMYSKPTYTYGNSNWLESYFISKPDHPAGTLFNYDSCGSYVLGSIVKKVTGKPFDEYLKEKVLFDIGFDKSRRCLIGPDGESWAGSGLIITPRELAAFTNLLLNKGNYNGKQLISKEFVRQATTAQVFNCNDGSDYSYNCGYGYQTWILKDNAFYLNGMGGQMAIAFPDSGLVFVCTADVQGNPCGKHIIFDSLWNAIVSSLDKDDNCDEDYCKILEERCQRLEFKPVPGKKHTETEKLISGKRYILDDNPMEISEITFFFDENSGYIDYKNPRGQKHLEFGLSEFVESYFPEIHYSGEQLGKSADRMFKCLNCGVWTNESTFVINCFIIDDYIGNLTITAGFKDEKIGITMKKNAQFFLDEYNGFAGGAIK